MQPWLDVELLTLLSLANFTPIVLNRLLGRRLAYRLDGGLRFFDGQPLLGVSKTIRGLIAAMLVTSAAASLMNLGWKRGLTIGSVAMGGDLFSSFVKRRMQMVPSSRATGLDQIPEALFPLLVSRTSLALSVFDIFIVVAIFVLGEMGLSILFFRLHLRERPY